MSVTDTVVTIILLFLICLVLMCFCVFQRSGAFPGHNSEGSEGQTGGGAQICGAAEETVRLNT